MTRDLAEKLKMELIRSCPVDSGALKQSITIVQFTDKEFVVQIGNESGKEINGSSATNVYAAYTNRRYLGVRVKGTSLVKRIPNKNYHWVNNAIQRWIESNRLDLSILCEYDLEEEEEEYGEI